LPGLRPLRWRSDRSLGFFCGLSDDGGREEAEESLPSRRSSSGDPRRQCLHLPGEGRDLSVPGGQHRVPGLDDLAQPRAGGAQRGDLISGRRHIGHKTPKTTAGVP